MTGIKPLMFVNYKLINNGFSHLLLVQHPSIYTFMNGLRRQKNMSEVKITQSTDGNPHMT